MKSNREKLNLLDGKVIKNLSAKELALMVKTMLDEKGFYMQHPKAAKILLKYLDNLNKKINLVEIKKASNEDI